MSSSDKSRGVAFALCFVLGVFGAHRFYAGRQGSAVLQACTLGGVGLWWLYDMIMIGTGEFTDAEGRRLRRWDPEVPEYGERDLPPEVAQELEAMRAELAELAERVDFAERLLAQPRDAAAARSGTGLTER